MPTPTGRARSGDIYIIPLDVQRHVVVKVIYVSHYFRNVIGIIPASRCFSNVTEAAEFLLGEPVLYTAQVCAKAKWSFLRTEEVAPHEIERTRRIVAADLYVGDDRLREATREELRVLPKMEVGGCQAVFDALCKRYAIRPRPGPGGDGRE